MRHLFLALLADGPRHGYELRSTLEQTFGSLLPALNTGQIYTTLQRLERDGLVDGAEVPGDTRNKRTYALTAAGEIELRTWIESPVPGTRLKDEFFMKLVVGQPPLRRGGPPPDRPPTPGVPPVAARPRRAGPHVHADDTVAGLLVEGAQLHIEADLRWLDLCTSRLLPKEQP